jgi:hypothetical protein
MQYKNLLELRPGEVAQAVEYLHSKHEALSLNPSTVKRRKE